MSTFEFYIKQGEIHAIYNKEDHALESLLKNDIQYPGVYAELKQIADHIYENYTNMIDWDRWEIYASGEDWSRMLGYFIRTYFADKDMILDAIINNGQVTINLEEADLDAHKVVSERMNNRSLEIA